MDDPRNLIKAIRSSEGHAIESRLEYLYSTYTIFDRNFQQMWQYLDDFKDMTVNSPIWQADKTYELGAVGQEALRLLHNFLASAKTWIDVSRALINRHYKSAPFLAEYQQEVNQKFTANPLATFVQDLRNYMLHFRVPVTYTQMTLEADAETGGLESSSSVVLDRRRLLEWEKWSAPARSLLEAEGADIDILGFSSQYHALIRAFSGWIQRRLGHIHEHELSSLREMRKNLETAKKARQSRESTSRENPDVQ